MAYIPPSPSINFDFTGVYLPPTGNSVDFNAVNWQIALGSITVEGLTPTLTAGDAVNMASISLLGLQPTHSDGSTPGVFLGSIALTGLQPESVFGVAAQPVMGDIGFYGLEISAINRTLTNPSSGWIAVHYRCVLSATGFLDLELPISSFQARLRNTGQSYLSVVVPGADFYIEAIDERISGYIVVYKDYVYSDGSIEAYSMCNVSYETLQIYQGGKSGKTATLSGSSPMAIDSGQSFTLTNPTYYNHDGTKKRYRCDIDPRVRPGDNASINNDNFIIGEIIWVINPSFSSMEIAEA